jgi:hypothetical protein
MSSPDSVLFGVTVSTVGLAIRTEEQNRAVLSLRNRPVPNW